MNKYREFDKQLEDFAFMLAEEMGLDVWHTGSIDPKFYGNQIKNKGEKGTNFRIGYD